MSETIEFEATAKLPEPGEYTPGYVELTDIDGGLMPIDYAMDGRRFKVTFAQMDQEPVAPPESQGVGMNNTIKFEALMTDRSIDGPPGPRSVSIGLAIMKPFHTGYEVADGFHAGSTFIVTMTQIEPEPELKPCPRCGGKMELKPPEFGIGAYAVCHQCHAYGPLGATCTEAIQAHNARESPELDPCPHCGGEWEWRCVEQIYAADLYSAHCMRCNFRSHDYLDLRDLADAVNRRA